MHGVRVDVSSSCFEMPNVHYRFDIRGIGERDTYIYLHSKVGVYIFQVNLRCREGRSDKVR